VPAEFEPQEDTWVQWPQKYEKHAEPAFVKMALIIPKYQPLRILSADAQTERDAKEAIRLAGGDPKHRNIHYHRVANDNAWMRDNGPVYVQQGDKMHILSFKFDGWGGRFGPDVEFEADDAVPGEVGKILNMAVK
jgi:agmatine deiminase